MSIPEIFLYNNKKTGLLWSKPVLTYTFLMVIDLSGKL